MKTITSHVYSRLIPYLKRDEFVSSGDNGVKKPKKKIDVLKLQNWNDLLRKQNAPTSSALEIADGLHGQVPVAFFLLFGLRLAAVRSPVHGMVKGGRRLLAGVLLGVKSPPLIAPSKRVFGELIARLDFGWGVLTQSFEREESKVC